MSPIYLGDGAYVRHDAETDELIVYTHDGVSVGAEVFFDRRAALKLHEAIALLLYPRVSEATP